MLIYQDGPKGWSGAPDFTADFKIYNICPVTFGNVWPPGNHVLVPSYVETVSESVFIKKLKAGVGILEICPLEHVHMGPTDHLCFR